MTARNSASLPELTFKKRDFVDRKMFSEDVPQIVKRETRKVPGYTGHMHASQHVFGQSFGRVARSLASGATQSLATSQRLCEFGEDRPQGNPLQGDGARIPGYTGIIRTKDNHIYGHTYADSTRLALKSVSTIESGGNASALPELTDYRPTGRIDLYTQRGGDKIELGDRPLPFYMTNRPTKFQYTRKHALKDDGITQVDAGTHRLPGYTGHLHGAEEHFAETYGSLSRSIRTRGGSA